MNSISEAQSMELCSVSYREQGRYTAAEMCEQTIQISRKGRSSPQLPPLSGLSARRLQQTRPPRSILCCADARHTRDLMDKLFAEGYQSDVVVQTNDGSIQAHASILGMASPVMKNMLEQSNHRTEGRIKTISIRGVPHNAARVFLRFLYTSCYEQEEMNQYVLHLLVMSHVFSVPKLKKICVQQLENGLLNVENVMDIFQLASLCDAPRLCLLCHRMVLRRFKDVSATEGWKILRQSNPKLEKDILESVIDADTKKAERLKKLEERRIYIQLHEAMEALVHICRDGCRTIGPSDKVLKHNSGPCEFPACKGLEALVRHFASCKNRMLGGCTHCKRMWQLLELHSRLCTRGENCKVPLCRHFQKRIKNQSKKEEVKWKLLVNKIREAKNFIATNAALMVPSVTVVYV